jgi:hypothetical protein
MHITVDNAEIIMLYRVLICTRLGLTSKAAIRIMGINRYRMGAVAHDLMGKWGKGTSWVRDDSDVELVVPRINLNKYGEIDEDSD